MSKPSSKSDRINREISIYKFCGFIVTLIQIALAVFVISGVMQVYEIFDQIEEVSFFMTAFLLAASYCTFSTAWEFCVILRQAVEMTHAEHMEQLNKE